MKNGNSAKASFFAAFSVGAVLFSAHAGGGFATGNQANTYYVYLGWVGVLSAVGRGFLRLRIGRTVSGNGEQDFFKTIFHDRSPFDYLIYPRCLSHLAQERQSLASMVKVTSGRQRFSAAERMMSISRLPLSKAL